MKILICDDDDDTAAVLSLLLEKAGHTTETVHTCEAIWRALKSNWPDLILMDIATPFLGGEATVKLLKKETKTKDIKIILVSAHYDLETRATRCGADGHITKPFQISELRYLVQKNAPKANTVA